MKNYKVKWSSFRGGCRSYTQTLSVYNMGKHIITIDIVSINPFQWVNKQKENFFNYIKNIDKIFSSYFNRGEIEKVDFFYIDNIEDIKNFISHLFNILNKENIKNIFCTLGEESSSWKILSIKELEDIIDNLK